MSMIWLQSVTQPHRRPGARILERVSMRRTLPSTSSDEYDGGSRFELGKVVRVALDVKAMLDGNPINRPPLFRRLSNTHWILATRYSVQKSRLAAFDWIPLVELLIKIFWTQIAAVYIDTKKMELLGTCCYSRSCVGVGFHQGGVPGIAKIRKAMSMADVVPQVRQVS